ncbi:MAG: enolase C-terminal domain-like protein, partial [Nitrososphaerota archaeon]
YLFYRYKSKDGKGGESTPEMLMNYYDELCKRYGTNFRGAKLKGGVFSPQEELKLVRFFRENLGDDFLLRFDPNAAWSVETSIRFLRQMENYNLEYVEDPTWTLEGMSIVRKSVNIPLGTNMCVISFDQIPPAISMHAIDIIGLDLHYWGGFTLCKKLVGVAETFQLGLYVHSDRELGISTAAILHFCASHPYISHAIDTHYHYQVGDVITEEFYYNKGGVFKVPDGPGLGIEIDNKKLERWHQYYRQHGDVIEFLDPYRPEWIPRLPLW